MNAERFGEETDKREQRALRVTDVAQVFRSEILHTGWFSDMSNKPFPEEFANFRCQNGIE